MLNYLLQLDMRISSDTVSDEMYIFRYNLKKNTIKMPKLHSLNKICDKMYILCIDFKSTIENQELNFVTKICEMRNKG